MSSRPFDGSAFTVVIGRSAAPGEREPRPWFWRVYVSDREVEVSKAGEGLATYEEASAVALERLIAYLRRQAESAVEKLDQVFSSTALGDGLEDLPLSEQIARVTGLAEACREGRPS